MTVVTGVLNKESVLFSVTCSPSFVLVENEGCEGSSGTVTVAA